MAFKVCVLVALFAVARAGFSQMPYGSQQNEMMYRSQQYSMPMDSAYSGDGMGGSAYASGPMYNSEQMYQPMPEGVPSTFDSYHQQHQHGAMPMMPNNYNVRYTSTYVPNTEDQMANYHRMTNDRMPQEYSGPESSQYQTAAMPQLQYEDSSLVSSGSMSSSMNYGRPEGSHMMNSGAYSPSSVASHVSFNGNNAQYHW